MSSLSFELSDVRDFCVACGDFIEGDRIQRYLQYGNWDRKCVEKCKRRLKQAELKRVRERDNPLRGGLTKKDKKEIYKRFFAKFDT